MRQRGDCSRFALEARQPIGITRHAGWQDFDRDVSAQARVAGAVDLSHVADADGRKHFIRAEPGAGNEGQQWPDYRGPRDSDGMTPDRRRTGFR
jgi:hypothetical protein